jgi:polygalacturonase
MRKTCFTGLFLASILTVEAAVYNVLDFGADNSGKTLTTSQIQHAIEQCYNESGGRVYLPNGQYLIGTLHLKSNIELHLEKGATLVAVTDITQYQKVNQGRAGMFYTENAENVSITGEGTILGNGMKFMYPDSLKFFRGNASDRTLQGNRFRSVDKGLGDGPIQPGERFNQMIIFSNCRNVTLRDFKCIDAPYWTILIVHCEEVRVTGLSINNNLLIPNSDGLDVISSSNVNVSDCVFICGDDAIVVSGYAVHFGDPGFKNILKPSQNINISNCVLKSRSSGIRIGCWDQNQMSNYNFSNITVYDSNCGINICIRDSGSIQNVNFSNIRIETRLHTGVWWGQGEAIKITAIRDVGKNPLGTIKNIFFSNITAVAENSVILYASDESKIKNISFNNFEFILRKSLLEDAGGGNYDFRPTIVKDKALFKTGIPAVFIENAENVYFNQGNIGWDGVEKKHYTNALKAVSVKNMRLNSVEMQPSPANPEMPVLYLDNCMNVYNNNNKIKSK